MKTLTDTVWFASAAAFALAQDNKKSRAAGQLRRQQQLTISGGHNHAS